MRVNSAQPGRIWLNNASAMKLSFRKNQFDCPTEQESRSTSSIGVPEKNDIKIGRLSRLEESIEHHEEAAGQGFLHLSQLKLNFQHSFMEENNNSCLPSGREMQLINLLEGDQQRNNDGSLSLVSLDKESDFEEIHVKGPSVSNSSLSIEPLSKDEEGDAQILKPASESGPYSSTMSLTNLNSLVIPPSSEVEVRADREILRLWTLSFLPLILFFEFSQWTGATLLPERAIALFLDLVIIFLAAYARKRIQTTELCAFVIHLRCLFLYVEEVATNLRVEYISPFELVVRFNFHFLSLAASTAII